MMNSLLTASFPPVSSFSEVVARYEDALLTFTEEEALRASHWEKGEDARLREDSRFRPSPWGRWTLANRIIANDSVFRSLVGQRRSEGVVSELIEALNQTLRYPCVLCPGDPRFIVQDDTVRLSAPHLSREPLLEDAAGLEKYVTHLPVHTLKAVAASEPAGEWGLAAQEEMIETIGWVRVELSRGRKLSDRMFVARIEGHSMDDGRSGLVDGGLAVFELWPAGTRQFQNVLVRGAFSDPETGSYAVKRYVADTRDEEGLHHRITLVSLNHDKDRYPDIELDVEDAGDVAVVARVVEPLSPDQFAREPKQLRRQGRRDLTSPKARADIQHRLRHLANEFFNGQAPDQPGEKTDQEGWRARFVCLDAESGGLHVETSPLEGLPPLAKKLSVSSGEASTTVLASNLRARVWRTTVPPSSAPYRWSAPAFEDLLDDDLEAMTLPGLSDDRVFPFRVDAAGVGQTLAGNSVSAGQRYRLLVPPALAGEVAAGLETVDLPGGWFLSELELPEKPSVELKQILERLGLQLGRSAPVARWVLRPPAAYRLSPAGDAYPVFTVGDSPVLEVAGVRTRLAGELVVFGVGGDQLTSLPLPAGGPWIIQLDDLAAGQYMLEVVHARTGIERVRVPFAVEESTPSQPAARLTVRIGEEDLSADENGRFLYEGDLTRLGGEDLALAVQAPALWSIYGSWADGRRRWLGRHHGGPNGVLDPAELVEQTADARDRVAIGNLTLVAGELGWVELRHTRWPTPEEVQAKLAELVQERAEIIDSLAGQFRLLRSNWIEPVLEQLGYLVEGVPEEVLHSAPAGMTALLLYRTRRESASIRRELFRPLVVTRPNIDIEGKGVGTARGFAHLLCEQYGLDEAMVTDGGRWALHRRGFHGKLRTWDIRTVASTENMMELEFFLRDCSVWA